MSSDSKSQSDQEAIALAARLESMGIEVRSASLMAKVDEINTFNENGGNRAMRRAEKRAARKKTSGRERKH